MTRRISHKTAAWEPVKNVFVRTTIGWERVFRGYVMTASGWQHCHLRTIEHRIQADAQELTLADLVANPTLPAHFIFTVESGVVITSTDASIAAITTGTFPAGSTLTLINHGEILGLGGAGGHGETIRVVGTCVTYPATDGEKGGSCLEVSLDVNIDNTDGYMWAGAGGGGGGAPYIQIILDVANGCGGGGGAGLGTEGRGYQDGQGCTFLRITNGADGGPGTETTGGAGGVSGFGNNGGSGGDLGEAGSAGAGAGGGAGGALGDAVTDNGHTITWLGGFNPTQVIGSDYVVSVLPQTGINTQTGYAPTVT